VNDKDDFVASTNLPPWAVVLVAALLLATCAITNATEDAALAECYRSGHAPAECKP
jgi:hypothetical protein